MHIHNNYMWLTWNKQYITPLINISIKSGINPSKLKIAKITPIFKSDDKTDANNYRLAYL